MAVEIARLGAGEAGRAIAEIRRIYAAAFAAPPYAEGPAAVRGFAQAFADHAGRRGFQCVVAREPGATALLGFAYGYTTAAGQPWRDAVADALGEARVERWLGDAFELVDLAVDPPAHGRGIGGRLHDAMLDALPHRAALLSTAREETPALHLYAGRGWQTLVEEIWLPGATLWMRVLSRDLAAWRRRAAGGGG